MAQAGFFMYQRWDGAAVGVFGTQNAAQQAAVDGEYVIVPIEANRVYANMVDETLPGAIVYQASGYDSRLVAMENDLANTKAQAQTKFGQIDGRLDGHDADVTDLQARVTVLEGS